MSEVQCPKCKGEMVRGFILDRTYGANLVGSWHEGQPKKSFWTTTKAPIAAGIPVGVFRCVGCGYLEFYSNASFAAE